MNIYYRVFWVSILSLVLCFTANAQSRISLTWEVLKYDIVATLPQNYTADRNLDVKASLTVKNISSRAYSTLSLRISDQAEIISIIVNGDTADFRKAEEKISSSRSLQKLITRVPLVSSGQTTSVTVNYKLNVKENTGLNSLSPVNSQFLPLSHWYPTPTSWYFPGGSDFAPYSLRVNASNGERVISSGDFNQSNNSFNQKLNGQPFFVSGNWDSVAANSPQAQMQFFLSKGSGNTEKKRAEELQKLITNSKLFAENLFGKLDNVPLRIVSVNRGGGFSDGGTIFVDDSVFKRQKLDSQTVMTVVEGVVKMWLGNKIKVKGDGYGVIREGLSKYVATEFIEQKYGKEIADIERLKQRINYSAIARRDSPLNFISPLEGYYYTASANKGAMIWKFLSKEFGQELFSNLRNLSNDGSLSLGEIRSIFSTQKDYLDYMLDKNTEMNLLVGLPQQRGGQTIVALRNLGEVNANVDVAAITSNGQKLTTRVVIPAKNFGQASFDTNSKIIRVEVDAEKVYPQTDYSDDIAPKEIGENDPILFIKRDFDRQKFDDAEKKARKVLQLYPNFDDAKILLARSLLAQKRNSEAQRVYQSVLNEKMPTARSLAWANVGLGEVAQRTGQNSQARGFFEEAIKADAELGATLLARAGRNKLNLSSSVDNGVTNFFSSFDKVVTANSKSGVDSMLVPGEVSKFANRVAGQVQKWSTKVLHIDKIDDETILVEANMDVKLLNRSDESGMAVYRLSKVGNSWKLSGVEIFEVS